MKINEIFYSIQGEGRYIGTPTAFIRTTWCNLRCSWCDTKYAYAEGTEMTIKEILRVVKKFPTKFVCITGGEPLIQSEINSLIKLLLKNKYKIIIETNGSISIRNIRQLKEVSDNSQLTISLDIKCPSSEMHCKMLFSNIKFLTPADTLKFVIKDNTDYKYARRIILKHNPKAQIVFQPVVYGKLNRSGVSKLTPTRRGGLGRQLFSMSKKLNWLIKKVLEDRNGKFEKFHIRILPQLHKFCSLH